PVKAAAPVGTRLQAPLFLGIIVARHTRQVMAVLCPFVPSNFSGLHTWVLKPDNPTPDSGLRIHPLALQAKNPRTLRIHNLCRRSVTSSTAGHSQQWCMCEILTRNSTFGRNVI